MIGAGTGGVDVTQWPKDNSFSEIAVVVDLRG
jgi:hypothetical protein